MSLGRSLTVATALLTVHSASRAAEATYDFVVCNHSKHTMLEASADVVTFGVEQWGVVASSTTKAWENASTRCVGYVRVTSGKAVGKGTCKWFTASGDTAVGEFELSPTGEATWAWLTGTGGLKGIGGRGTFRELFSARPAAEGTSQGCRRDWGTYSLP